MELKETIRTVPPGELARGLHLLREKIEAAHRSGIDIKDAYDLYTIAVKDLARDDLLDAFMQYEHSLYELTKAVNSSKMDVRGFRAPGIKALSFFFRLYGVSALVFGAGSSVLFGLLLSTRPGGEVLGVPLWASFFAGLGSSAQILSGVVRDLRRDGLVTGYKRIWYTAIPILAMIFGYASYLVVASGLVAFNISSEAKESTVMFVCFMTGFLTIWIVDRLSSLSRNL